MFSCVARESNKQKKSPLRKAMTTKYPSMPVLMETAEELSHRNCELRLQWIRRDLNRLADDLANEEFKSFDPGLIGGYWTGYSRTPIVSTGN